VRRGLRKLRELRRLREKKHRSLLTDKGISAATKGDNSGGKNGYNLAISNELSRKNLLFLNSRWFAKSYGKK
jgi:hypothetical protein